jgi:outer membrane receptor protein involved in Fe transport
LSSITGLQTNNGTSYTDNSYTYDGALSSAFGVPITDPFSLYVNTTTKKFTQELRAASHDSTVFQWIVGGFLSNEKTSEIVDLLDTATPAGTFFGISPFTSFLPSTYREYAVYGDGTIFFTKQLELGLGVRYSRQKQAYEETVSGLLATGSAAVLTPPVALSDQSVMTYLINPKFHITDDVMVYARAASGFRPGGPNFVLSPGLGNPTYDPDRLWSYELGEKSTFLDKRATLNFDIYDILWKDIQVTVNVGGINQLENAGTARVTGAEMSFDYRIIPALTVGGSTAYTDARTTSIAKVIDLNQTGVRLPLSPRFNFALLGTYTMDLPGNYTGALNVTDRWIGQRDSAFGTAISPSYTLASYNITDLNLTVRAPYHVEYGLFLRNVFDKAGEVSANVAAYEYNKEAPAQVFLTQPRTVGASVNYKF